jgi:hypothetical protein
VLYLYSTRDEIKIDPEYQRMGEIWNLDKRQLLIDSILNGFDIPKIYLHELVGHVNETSHKYAIIDGRQRLESIWQFIDGAFPLGDGFEYLLDDKVKAAGLTYRELGEKYPRLKTRFDSTSLSVVIVQTDDLDLIEEMFSRLNEAVPLNAAEKRNAFGGPLPKAIRDVAEHAFFRQKCGISNRRFQHRDLAAKFLYLAYEKKVADTKKIYLDEFVRSFKGKPPTAIEPIVSGVTQTLDAMSHIFVNRDRLLRSSGMIVLYFLLFREYFDQTWRDTSLSRTNLERFERLRADNRTAAEQDIAKASYELLEFDRYMQTPNDGYALKLRLDIIRKTLGISGGEATQTPAPVS